MALRKTISVEGKSIIQTSNGSIENGLQSISFSAYVKVISVIGDKAKMTAHVNFKGDPQEFTKQYEIPVSVKNNAPNFITQAYSHLKTLPEFADAVDC